jgi:hypothetical protein
VTARRLRVAAVVAIVITATLVIRNQVKVYRGRQARAALMQQRHPAVHQPPEVRKRRQALYDMLQPVALANCQLERFGESHDGGYLMCGNLLGEVRAAYSYGINGYDKWGCDISNKLDLTVHQYDCFNTDQPFCFGGDTVFHAECVGDTRTTIEGRPFDTIANQLVKNGDGGKRLVLKVDVEGAEWDSLLAVPDPILQQIDQMAVEFHWLEDQKFRWIGDEKYLGVVKRLKEFFEVAHIHFNNSSCIGDLAPFPTWAYEVLFVSKRLGIVDRSRQGGGPHPLDAPNNPSLPDCQPNAR